MAFPRYNPRNKYGVAPKEARTWQGKLYASKREMQVAAELQMLKARGELLEYEEQPRFTLIPKPNRIDYVADFRVVWRDGGLEEYIDVKGVETPVFKMKMRLMRHFFPNVKIKLWR